MTIVVVVALAMLAASWAVYPLWLLTFSGENAAPLVEDLGDVEAVVVTRDDPSVVARRVENLLGSEKVRFKVVSVVLDWTVRQRLEEYRARLGSRARVVIGDEPGGKAAGLNAGVRSVSAKWVVLADSWQFFMPDTVAQLFEGVTDSAHAAVSGRVVHDHDDFVLRAYWRYENAIRNAQSRRHSVVTTSGAVCLLRKEAFTPLPVGTICDDLFMTLELVERGYRVGYAPAAVARDSREHTRGQLFQKKVRTLTGLWQLIAFRPRVLLPWRNPIFMDFLLHKLARLITPYLVIVSAFGAVVLLLPHLYVAVARHATTAIIGFVTCGGCLFLGRKRIVPVITWVGMLMSAPLMATRNALRGDWAVWTQHKPAEDFREDAR